MFNADILYLALDADSVWTDRAKKAGAADLENAGYLRAFRAYRQRVGVPKPSALYVVLTKFDRVRYIIPKSPGDSAGRESWDAVLKGFLQNGMSMVANQIGLFQKLFRAPAYLYPCWVDTAEQETEPGIKNSMPKRPLTFSESHLQHLVQSLSKF